MGEVPLYVDIHICAAFTASRGDPYRGTSLIRKRNPLGPYRRPMPRVLGGSSGGGHFLMGKIPL